MVLKKIIFYFLCFDRLIWTWTWFGLEPLWTQSWLWLEPLWTRSWLGLDSPRSWSEGANKTTSSAKSRDEIVWSPNQTHSGPWLHLEILSIKIMSPTCTGNKSDLLPAMQTKLLLWSYRDRTALSNRPRTPYSQSTPHRMTRGTQSNTFSKSTKHTWIGWAGLVGQTPMHPPAPWKGYRAGPVFPDRDENHTVPPETKVPLFSSTLA